MQGSRSPTMRLQAYDKMGDFIANALLPHLKK
jgi:hypothetical protein